MQGHNRPTHKSTVYFIDDDADLRDSLRWLVETGGYGYEAFAGAREFLTAFDPRTSGCILLDCRMPEMNGADLFAELRRRDVKMPIIFMTGYGDVPTAVRALQDGAFDFVEKPCNRKKLLDCINQAVEYDTQARILQAQKQAAQNRLKSLTHAESEVMQRILEGKPNKRIAADLNISERTVEYRRARLMKKLGARSVSDIVHAALTCEFAYDDPRFQTAVPHFISHQQVPSGERSPMENSSP